MVLIRAIYFVLVGWWISLIWIMIAYILGLTIIGLPFSLMMYNILPQIITLKPKSKENIEEYKSKYGGWKYSTNKIEFTFVIRAVYYILIGWWLGGFLLFLGYILCITIIGLPVGLLILNRIPAILTLKRNY